MKRFLAVITLVFMLAVPSFALSNKEYGRLMANENFARADRKLNNVYLHLRKTVSRAVWRILSSEQQEWIDWGRDEDAQSYIDQGYNRTRAYTQATNDRADYIIRRAKAIAKELENRRQGRR